MRCRNDPQTCPRTETDWSNWLLRAPCGFLFPFPRGLNNSRAPTNGALFTANLNQSNTTSLFITVPEYQAANVPISPSVSYTSLAPRVGSHGAPPPGTSPDVTRLSGGCRGETDSRPHSSSRASRTHQLPWPACVWTARQTQSTWRRLSQVEGGQGEHVTPHHHTVHVFGHKAKMCTNWKADGVITNHSSNIQREKRVRGTRPHDTDDSGDFVLTA